MQTKPQPPAHLSAGARGIWRHIVKDRPAGYFGDRLETLADYCATCSMLRVLGVAEGEAFAAQDYRLCNRLGAVSYSLVLRMCRLSARLDARPGDQGGGRRRTGRTSGAIRGPGKR